MLVVRPRRRSCGVLVALLVVVGLFALCSLFAPSGTAGTGHAPPATLPTVGRTQPSTFTNPPPANPQNASTVELVYPAPSEVTAGTPFSLVWQAVNAQGSGVTGFAATCALRVAASGNGSTVPAWVNSSRGPLVEATNGTFTVALPDWTSGSLNLTLTLARATDVVVRLFGPQLPSSPSPVGLLVLPDLEHLVLYQPVFSGASADSNTTYWHVRDRFGDPAPGGLLVIEMEGGGGVNETVVPATWTAGGGTGAWVNYSLSWPGGGTLEVRDDAGATLLGPLAIAAPSSASNTSAWTLPWPTLVAVATVLVAGLVGLVALLYGGGPKPAAPATEGEEELRRLAEGRATIVEIVRRSGPLTIRGIEAAWDPPPAPPAVADWVASLVTDGTLTAGFDDRGEARFVLAERSVGEPRVTLDEDALERGIARRDAALEDESGDRAGEGTNSP